MEENKKYTTKDVDKYFNENSSDYTEREAIEKFGIILVNDYLYQQYQHSKEQAQFYWDEMVKEQEERLLINSKEIENVKTLIDYDFDFIDEMLEGNDWWKHIGYVEVEKSDYKNCFYPSSDFYVEKGAENNKHYFMRQDDSEHNTFHNLVYQNNGGYGAEDSYYGYLLFPLTNGKYWKIEYQC